MAPIFLLLCTVGNSLGLAVMTRPSLRNTATAVFIASLAISDMVAVWTGLSRHFVLKLFEVSLPMTLADSASGGTGSWFDSQNGCHSVPTLLMDIRPLRLSAQC